jgi:glucosylceramidase
VALHLGPLLRKAGSAVKIWILDHNYNLWGRVIDELSYSMVSDFVDGIAWHGYVGEATAMTRVHESFPKIGAHWTEGGADYNQPDYMTNWTEGAETFNGIVNNWAQSITCWNLALDEVGKPNIGPFSCGGIVTVENRSQKVTRSGLYWALAHFSRHVMRGARVIATNGIGGDEMQHLGAITPITGLPSSDIVDGKMKTGVTHAAFRNPDGSYVLVLTNSGAATKKVQLLMGGNALEVELPNDSVQTLKWM